MTRYRNVKLAVSPEADVDIMLGIEPKPAAAGLALTATAGAAAAAGGGMGEAAPTTTVAPRRPDRFDRFDHRKAAPEPGRPTLGAPLGESESAMELKRIKELLERPASRD